MLIYTKKISSSSTLAIWKMEESEEELRQLFGNQPLTFLENIKSQKRRLELLSVRILIKTVCGENVNLIYDELGKPKLENSEFFISVSHTDGYAAILLSKNKFVGVDIEFRSTRVLRVKEKFLSENEMLKFRNLADENFEILWCAKECVFKCLPRTDVDFQEIDLQDFTAQKNSIFKAEIARLNLEFLVHFEQNSQFTLAWAEG